MSAAHSTIAKTIDCLTCGRTFVATKYVAVRRYCSRECHWRQRAAQRQREFPASLTCTVCLKPFTPSQADLRRCYCSAKCKKWAMDQRRKTVKRNAWVEDVSIGFLFDRDKGRCGICGKPVSRTTCHPDPMSPTIDHVIPLSKQGEHSYANTQLAHLRCNTLKNDRIEGLF